MLPEQNIEETKKENTNLGLGRYIQYVETRLNNRLLLLNNPDLMRILGLDIETVISETKKLVDISNGIDISKFAEGKQYQRLMELHTEHPDLWESFFKYKDGVLSSNVVEEFIKWIQLYIENNYYMLPGETALDADLRRLAFRKGHEEEWKEFCKYCNDEHLPCVSDLKFEDYVKNKGKSSFKM